jgi:flagellin-like protein
MIERIRQWTDESDRAVSPVIGVILMVAITVILAAVIGSFVLGIGGDISETPQVRLAVSDASDTIDTGGTADALFVIEHSGGDTIESDKLTLIVNNASDGDTKLGDITSVDEDLSVGDRKTISEASGSDGLVEGPAELRVRLVHKPSDNLLLDTTIEVE